MYTVTHFTDEADKDIVRGRVAVPNEADKDAMTHLTDKVSGRVAVPVIGWDSAHKGDPTT